MSASSTSSTIRPSLTRKMMRPLIPILFPFAEIPSSSAWAFEGVSPFYTETGVCALPISFST